MLHINDVDDYNSTQAKCIVSLRFFAILPKFFSLITSIFILINKQKNANWLNAHSLRFASNSKCQRKTKSLDNFEFRYVCFFHVIIVGIVAVVVVVCRKFMSTFVRDLFFFFLRRVTNEISCDNENNIPINEAENGKES